VIVKKPEGSMRGGRGSVGLEGEKRGNCTGQDGLGVMQTIVIDN
jgi:hypothetical protein